MNSIFYNNLEYGSDYIKQKYYIYSSFICRIGLRANSRVLVLHDVTPALLVFLLSLYDSDITYIPISSHYGKEMINGIIDIVNPDIIVTERKYINIFLGIDKPIILLNQTELYDNKYPVSIKNDDFQYIISNIYFTSGSTGKSKGVMIKKDSLNNLIQALLNAIDFCPNKRILCLTEVTFDIFFLESIFSLKNGMDIVLANTIERRNPRLLLDLIYQSDINMIQMTPTRMSQLLKLDIQATNLKKLTDILLGGEPLPLSMLQYLQQKTNAHIFNLYGPTETTVWSTVADLTKSDCVHIGKPINNTKITIVRNDDSACEKNEIGEICISGDGLGHGYINNGDCIDNGFTYTSLKERIYKTGDYGLLRDDMNVEIYGRKDEQIKFNGYRINLNGISSLLSSMDGIEYSYMHYIKDENKILAFYSGKKIEDDVLREFLSRKLPIYFIPNEFIHLRYIPYNQNGKIDKKALLDFRYRNLNINLNAPKCHQVYIVIAKETGLNVEYLLNKKDQMNTYIGSLVFVSIVLQIEQYFNIQFEDEKLSVYSFNDIENLIEYTDLLVKSC